MGTFVAWLCWPVPLVGTFFWRSSFFGPCYGKASRWSAFVSEECPICLCLYANLCCVVMLTCADGRHMVFLETFYFRSVLWRTVSMVGLFSVVLYSSVFLCELALRGRNVQSLFWSKLRPSLTSMQFRTNAIKGILIPKPLSPTSRNPLVWATMGIGFQLFTLHSLLRYTWWKATTCSHQNFPNTPIIYSFYISGETITPTVKCPVYVSKSLHKYFGLFWTVRTACTMLYSSGWSFILVRSVPVFMIRRIWEFLLQPPFV